MPEPAVTVWFAWQLGPIVTIGSLPGLAPGVRVSALGGYRSFAVQHDRSAITGTLVLWTLDVPTNYTVVLKRQ